LKGGLAVVGGINLGGSIEPVHNPVDVVEHALSKGASAILVPVSCRRQLVDLSDDVATKVQVLFYSDAADALRKVLHEGELRLGSCGTKGSGVASESLLGVIISVVRDHHLTKM